MNPRHVEGGTSPDADPSAGVAGPETLPAGGRAVQIKVNSRQFFETVIAALTGDGLPPAGQTDFAKNRGQSPMIIVAAAPKSGSTFLANTLMQLTGLRGFRLCAAYSTNEHDLYLPALCVTNSPGSSGCVSQLHMKGTFHNAALMRAFGIRPIILVRRIEDIVVSLQHDLREKAQAPNFTTGREGYSFIWQDECTQALSDERLIDLIIDLALPWFVNFYVSWQRLCAQGAVDALWLTYEQMLADTEGTLRQALQFLGVPATRPIDPELLSRKYGTFRDGRTGQGGSLLTARQKERIRALFAYYPGVDFGKYGL
jgi:hypothetical protein